MRLPQSPPKLDSLWAEVKPGDIQRIVDASYATDLKTYYHWDKLRRIAPPQGVTHQEWWWYIKQGRLRQARSFLLRAGDGGYFQFLVPDFIQERLHLIDMQLGGISALPPAITNPQTRDRYIVASLVEEAITSSQLEGAATTRAAAQKMLHTGRKPHTTDERMIVNNYLAMQRIRELRKEALSPDLVFDLHRRVTDGTLDNPSETGRLRRDDEDIVVGRSRDGGPLYIPPPARELPERLEAMCAFANGGLPGDFIHPVIRAILLHFWLAYDHPFVDGNGRTARALFYWSMLHAGYTLFEFVSISGILRNAPVKYARSFLYAETDGNDATYFIVAQMDVIRRALDALEGYVESRTREIRDLEARLHALSHFNHRQVELVRHALKRPHERYTIREHQRSHGVVHQTARTDMLGLYACGLLTMTRKGRAMVFAPAQDMEGKLRAMENGAVHGTDGPNEPLLS